MDQILSFATFEDIPIEYLNELVNLTLSQGYMNDHAWALKARIMALLQLSPNDVDYLRSALEIATLSDDQSWLRALITHFEELIEKRPYHFELMELLPDFKEGQSPSQRPS